MNVKDKKVTDDNTYTKKLLYSDLIQALFPCKNEPFINDLLAGSYCRAGKGWSMCWQAFAEMLARACQDVDKGWSSSQVALLNI